MLSQYVVLDESGVVKIPATLSYEEAATLPCAGVTAWNGLFTRGHIQPGDYVLLEGTGGVSLLGLSLAVADGAKPIITSSHDEKLARAKALGAVGGVNYLTTPTGKSRSWRLPAVPASRSFWKSAARTRWLHALATLGGVVISRSSVD